MRKIAFILAFCLLSAPAAAQIPDFSMEGYGKTRDPSTIRESPTSPSKPRAPSGGSGQPSFEMPGTAAQQRAAQDAAGQTGGPAPPAEPPAVSSPASPGQGQPAPDQYTSDSRPPSRSDNVTMQLGPISTTPPTTPEIEEVTYMTIPPAKSLTERIERLVHGLTTPVLPEHDHFGYEIRRYMANVGATDVMSDPEKVAEELMNADRAGIILQHWQKKLQQEMTAIEAELETATDAASLRSKYQYNSGVAKTALAEIGNWIDNNRKMLEFLQEIRGTYEIDYPTVTFQRIRDQRQFASYYEARSKSLANIQEYGPWRMMAY